MCLSRSPLLFITNFFLYISQAPCTSLSFALSISLSQYPLTMFESHQVFASKATSTSTASGNLQTWCKREPSSLTFQFADFLNKWSFLHIFIIIIIVVVVPPYKLNHHRKNETEIYSAAARLLTFLTWGFLIQWVRVSLWSRFLRRDSLKNKRGNLFWSCFLW